MIRVSEYYNPLLFLLVILIGMAMTFGCTSSRFHNEDFPNVPSQDIGTQNKQDTMNINQSVVR